MARHVAADHEFLAEIDAMFDPEPASLAGLWEKWKDREAGSDLLTTNKRVRLKHRSQSEVNKEMLDSIGANGCGATTTIIKARGRIYAIRPSEVGSHRL